VASQNWLVTFLLEKTKMQKKFKMYTYANDELQKVNFFFFN